MKGKPLNIQIESGIPIPDKYPSGVGKSLKEAILKMKDGDSFIFYNNRSPYRAGRDVRVKIKSRKLNGEGFRIWRIGPL